MYKLFAHSSCTYLLILLCIKSTVNYPAHYIFFLPIFKYILFCCVTIFCTVTSRLRRPARVTSRLTLPICQSHLTADSADLPESPHGWLRRPARVTSRLTPPTCQSHLMSDSADLPESPHVWLRRPARVTSRLRWPARVTSRLRWPATVTPRLRWPARVTPRLRWPARISSRHSSLPSVTSRLCCLFRPALVGSGLIGSTWTWPSVPSPGSTSLLDGAVYVKRLEAALWGGGGSVTNLVASHHTTAAHHPWTTSPIMHCTHSFPSTITPITQLSPITNQTWLSHHTCTSFTHLTHLIHSPTYKHHTSLHTLQSLVLAPADISERSPFPLIATSVFDPGLPYLGTLNLCLWPRPLPGIVYVSALPLIFLLLPADHCQFDSASV